ncbi:PspA/IM30 family protein [Nostoc edaphicum]|uniref:PspA/IM30 family protein n=1 Tax=Nostoc edaphicum TaxID=264686 RepID=UPI001EEC0D34|nr:hypothetical protein [Nostoc edaphicum]
MKSWEQKVSEAQNEVLCSKPNTSEVSPTFISFEYKDVDISVEYKNVDVSIDDELEQLKALMLPPKPQEQTKAQKDSNVLLLEAIHETQEALKTAVINKECIHKNYEQAQEEVKLWNKYAHIALKNNDDNLAIKAVLKKKVQNKIALTLQTQLQQQEAIVAVLKQNLMTLENFKKTLGNDTKL